MFGSLQLLLVVVVEQLEIVGDKLLHIRFPAKSFLVQHHIRQAALRAIALQRAFTDGPDTAGAFASGTEAHG